MKSYVTCHKNITLVILLESLNNIYDVPVCLERTKTVQI